MKPRQIVEYERIEFQKKVKCWDWPSWTWDIWQVEENTYLLLAMWRGSSNAWLVMRCRGPNVIHSCNSNQTTVAQGRGKAEGVATYQAYIGAMSDGD